MINFNVPPCTGKELDYIKEAIASHKICGDGAFTKRCHAWMEERFGAEKVLLTTSGTTALDMAALLCGLQPEQQFQGEDMFTSDKPEVLGEIFRSGRRRSWLRTKQYSLDITTAENEEHTAPDRYDGKLIDLAADPLYHTNVYGSPAYAEIQQQLTGRLLERIAPYPIEVKRGDIPM